MAKDRKGWQNVIRDTGMGALGAIASEVVTDALNNNVGFLNKTPQLTPAAVDLVGIVLQKRGGEWLKPVGLGMSIMATAELARPLTSNLKIGMGRMMYSMGYGPGRRGREGVNPTR